VSAYLGQYLLLKSTKSYIIAPFFPTHFLKHLPIDCKILILLANGAANIKYDKLGIDTPA
jgi:hypothetical protein